MQDYAFVWSYFRHVKDKEVYFLQQSWARLMEMTESEVKWKLLSQKSLDRNNLN